MSEALTIGVRFIQANIQGPSESGERQPQKIRSLKLLNEGKDYWKHRAQKLETEQDLLNAQTSTQIFKGLCFYFDGFMGPFSVISLRERVQANGGRIAWHSPRKATHIVCYNLASAKRQEVYDGTQKRWIVKPDWIVDSHRQEKQAPIEPYLVYSKARDRPDLNQTSIHTAFATPAVPSTSSSTITSSSLALRNRVYQPLGTMTHPGSSCTFAASTFDPNKSPLPSLSHQPSATTVSPLKGHHPPSLLNTNRNQGQTNKIEMNLVSKRPFMLELSPSIDPASLSAMKQPQSPSSMASTPLSKPSLSSRNTATTPDQLNQDGPLQFQESPLKSTLVSIVQSPLKMPASPLSISSKERRALLSGNLGLSSTVQSLLLSDQMIPSVELFVPRLRPTMLQFSDASEEAAEGSLRSEADFSSHHVSSKDKQSRTRPDGGETENQAKRHRSFRGVDREGSKVQANEERLDDQRGRQGNHQKKKTGEKLGQSNWAYDLLKMRPCPIPAAHSVSHVTHRYA